MIYAQPPTATQSFPIRSQASASGMPSPDVRGALTKGLIRQASREIYPVNGLPTPSNCTLAPPAPDANVWCFDPIRKRRGLAMGDIAQPLYFTVGNGDGLDVDGPFSQTVPQTHFPGLNVRPGGVVLFNENSLAVCPAAPVIPLR